jgi:cardiolipin synthase
MHHAVAIPLVAAAALLSLGAAGHALLHKRDPRSALGWISVSLTMPFIGPFLYWCLGINRISRRAQRWQESGRRISGNRLHPRDGGADGLVELPPAAAHLGDLLNLEDRVVQAGLLPGNRIIPLVDGEEAYPAMLVAVRRAEHHINMCSYIFDADGIGAEFASHLRDAAERGVEVRVIIDALGERYSRRSLHQVLAGTEVQVRRYLPLSHGGYINLRNHRKLLIIDGVEAFTGGMNIRNRHQTASTPPDRAIRDLHFTVRGPVVADLQRVFLEDWHFVTGERLLSPLFFPPLEPCGNTLIRAVGDGPDKEFRKLEQIMLGALSCARDSVHVMTPYFIPDRPMVAALITAALRGVDVRIVLPGRNNLPFVQWASRAQLRELLANGVRVFHQPPPFVHTKLFLVDGVWSLVGSANIDTRSLRLNFELNLSVVGRDPAAALERYVAAALAQSHETTLDELDASPLPIRIRDNIARLFSPYL